MSRTNRLRTSVALLAGLSLIASACGDDQSGDAPSTVAVAATGDQEGSHAIVDDATVTAGLATTAGILAAAVGDPGTAGAEWDDAHESWETYEGTIKQNMPDSYLAMEDALAAFQTAAKAGDSAALTEAAADFEAAADAYLAAYPG